MLKILYDVAVLGGALVSLPFFLWKMLVHGKYRLSFKNKWGLGFPVLNYTSPHVIWVHAVSVGETLAVAPLLKKWHERSPEYTFVFSTTTETGQECAKKHLPFVRVFFYLPFDFSWNMKKILKLYNPEALVLVESDFWYNMLRVCRENRIETIALNGKISEKSLARYLKTPFFSRPLFSFLTCICAQNALYKQRFSLLTDPSKVHVTGNIKLDSPVEGFKVDPATRNFFKEKKDLPVLVIGSTHDDEELFLIKVLKPFISEKRLRVVLVPRHVERCSSLKEMLQKQELSYQVFSDGGAFNSEVLLVDVMGVLKSLYSYADVAIVGGTFVSHVGGHNLFEPLYFAKPVLYGPYVFSQQEMHTLIEQNGGGFKVADAKELVEILRKLLDDKRFYDDVSAKGSCLAGSVTGSVEATLRVLSGHLHPLKSSLKKE